MLSYARRLWLPLHAITGEALLKIRKVDNIMPSEGAFVRMRKRAAASASQAGIEGSGTSKPRRGVSSALAEGVSEVEAKVAGEDVIGRKRSRGEDEALKRRTREVSRGDDVKKGRSLVLKMTSACRDEIRHVLTPSPRGCEPQPLTIEVDTNERWTVMDKEPFQAFSAFNLVQDSDYYDTIPREEQMVSDFCRFAESYVGGSESVARAALQHDLDASKRVVSILEDKQKKSELLARRLEEKIKKSQEELTTLHVASEENDARLADLTKTIEERTIFWGEEKGALEWEVDSFLRRVMVCVGIWSLMVVLICQISPLESISRA